MPGITELNPNGTELVAGRTVISKDFPDPDVIGPLEFPIKYRADYKGRMVFTVIEEPASDIETLMKGFDTKEAVVGSRDNSLDERGDPIKKSPQQTINDKKALDQARQAGIVTTIGSKKPIKLSNKSVKLYLPQGIQIADGVQYENTDLGAIGALAERGAGAAASGSGAIQGVGNGIGSIIDAFSGTSSNSGIGRLAANKVASAFGQEVGAGVKSATRVTLNPNTRALFKAVNLRSFSFTFKLIPTSQTESVRIQEIIKFFRTELYPEEIALGQDQDNTIPVGYRFPNRFQIKMFYNNIEVATKLLPCYIESFQAVYNSTAMSMHKDGSFQEVDITMNFRESRTLSRKDVIEENY